MLSDKGTIRGIRGKEPIVANKRADSPGHKQQALDYREAVLARPVSAGISGPSDGAACREYLLQDHQAELCRTASQR